jgi:hypothetical protein
MMGDAWLKIDKYVATAAPGSPLIHYDFNEPSGSTATDSANGYNATFTLEDGNSVEAFWQVSGKYGGSVKFDSLITPIALQIPPGAFSGLTTAVSVSLWVNWDDPLTMPDVTNQLFSVHGGPGADYDPILGIETSWRDGDIRFWDDSNDTIADVSSDDWSGGWNHYAFVKDVTAETLKIYHNSELVSESDSNAPIVLPVDNAWIGMATDDPNAWHDEYSGQIDDFQIFDSNLSAEQVGHLASGGSGYVSLISLMNLYDLESAGNKAVNFRDYAVLMDKWLDKKYWPE